MARVSFNEAERARAATLAHARAQESLALVLQALSTTGAAAKLAADSGLSEATVSRWKVDGDLERSISLLSHLGFRVIGADHKVLEAKAYEFLVGAHIKVMQTAPGLILGVES